MPLKPFLQKLAAGESLQESEAMEAMRQIMDGNASDSQIGAYLMGLRMKGETAEEIAGCAKAMKDKALMIKSKSDLVVDTCGTGGDAQNTFNISTAAAFIAAGAGVYVAKHGNRAVSSSCGSADVLEALGVKLDLDPSACAEVLDEVGICFLFAPKFHPAMKHAAKPRKELGLRTIFNLLGPLSNPANARHQLLGVYDASLCELMCKALRGLGSLRAFVVHNDQGMDELGLKGNNTIAELKGGEVSVTTKTAKDFGLEEKDVKQLAGGDVQACAATLKSILEGKEKGSKRTVAVLNAAFAILVADKATGLEEALKTAEEAIDSGAAAEKLARLVEKTQRLAS